MDPRNGKNAWWPGSSRKAAGTVRTRVGHHRKPTKKGVAVHCHGASKAVAVNGHSRAAARRLAMFVLRADRLGTWLGTK